MSTVITFSKMHGLGNDFVVIDAINQNVSLTSKQIQYIADRHRGIGCDQILLVEKSLQPEIDFNYRIFNADGSEVGQCGNGARCLAKFVVDQKLTDKKFLRIKTSTTILECELLNHNQVKVNMGIPKEIQTITIENHSGVTLDIGNPHMVFLTTMLQKNYKDINKLGEICNHHAYFPQGVNVGFMHIIDRQHIELRVYERGAGETQACGSGACAAVIAGIQQQLLDNNVSVNLLGGELQIAWQGEHAPVWMTGAAEYVFEGEIALL